MDAPKNMPSSTGRLLARLWTWLGLDSLMGRYFAVSAALLAVLIAIAWVSSRQVEEVLATSQGRFTERELEQRVLHDLQQELSVAESALHRFLLNPDPADRRVALETLEQFAARAKNFWDTTSHEHHNPEFHATLEAFIRNAGRLQTDTQRLIELRADPYRLFPALSTLISEMQPSAAEFHAAASAALHESENNLSSIPRYETHRHFADARYFWGQVTASFRMLVANRFGAFAFEPGQGVEAMRRSIDMHREQVAQRLRVLHGLKDKGALGLVEEDAVERMQAAQRRWSAAYEKAVAIYTSERWRTDTALLRDVVQPLFAQINGQLRAIERQVGGHALGDIEATVSVADHVATIVWLFVGLITLASAGGVLLFELQIRRPLARMAGALRAEAAGEQPVLPAVRSVETRRLREAFDEMRAQVRARQERLQAVLTYAAEAIITIDECGLIESFNPAAERLFGYRAGEAIGQNVSLLVPEPHRHRHDEYLQRYLATGEKRILGQVREETGQRKDGTLIPITLHTSEMRVGGRRLFIGMIADNSERRAMTEELQRLAEHDPVTGLFNRRHFQSEFDRLMDRLQRNPAMTAALLYLDLDNFKYVNDTLGHAAGDKLLVEVAGVLRHRTRRSDVLARLGGDEFAVLLYDCRPEMAATIAGSFRQQLADYAFRHEGRAVTIGCSIGVAPIAADGASTADLMARADLACHLAKRAGRNRVRVWTPADAKDADAMTLHMGWSRRIRLAINNDLLAIACQPIVDTRTREPFCHEVLVRMLDENGELILPGGFFPAAERFGLSSDIDQWVIAHAIDLLAGQRRRNPNLRYSINLSAQSLTDPAVGELVASRLAATGLEPSALMFEVTEDAAITDMAAAMDMLGRLRSLGCLTALDDFGSGMSSFAYLRELPVDIVKIDGRFVKNMLTNPLDEAMVRAMSDIARVLGKRTVAEFIEDEATLKRVAQLGVDYGQGFYLGRPGVARGDPCEESANCAARRSAAP